MNSGKLWMYGCRGTKVQGNCGMKGSDEVNGWGSGDYFVRKGSDSQK